MPDALELLKSRRSVKPQELLGPPPSEAEIETLLTIASRVPDHGKLAPWRFIVFAGEARRKAGEAIAAAFVQKYPAATAEQIEWYAYDRTVLAALGLKPHEKIAGFVHIGRIARKPEDRARPALADIVTRF
jgi:nitroreductase